MTESKKRYDFIRPYSGCTLRGTLITTDDIVTSSSIGFLLGKFIKKVHEYFNECEGEIKERVGDEISHSRLNFHS